MTSVTSPNDHSPITPNPSVHPTAEEDNYKSDFGEIEDYDCDLLEGCGEDKSYNPEYMEIDGTFYHNILIPLIFTNRVAPENTHPQSSR